MAYVVAFIVGVLVYAGSLYVGFKVLGLKPNFGGAVVMALVCGTVALVPKIGDILGMAAFAFMVMFVMGEDLFPTGVALALVAGVVRFFAVLIVLLAVFR